MKKIITAIIAGYVVYSCASRKTEPFQGELSMDDPEVKNGKEYYMKYCQKCHPNGEKGLGPAINPNPAPGFIKSFQVRHGLGVMPHFSKDEISEEDLKDINKYLRALKTGERKNGDNP